MGASLSFPVVRLPSDYVAIVTGANTGIGYETAKWIAMMGGHVIIACRSEEKALEAIEKMQQDFKEHKQKGTDGITEADELSLEFLQLDLSSLKSTQSFVETFLKSGRNFHILICNAGVAVMDFQLTEDGHETHFQVNYLSHFLLSIKLLPVMLKSGEDCRMIFVSSDAYKIAGNFMLDQQDDKSYFYWMKNYGKSKLYQIMQMYSMNRRILGSNVSVTCIHPGVVGSNLGRNMPWFVEGALSIGGKVGIVRTSLDGAKTTLNAAVNPKFKGSRDIYFSDCKPTAVLDQATNVENQEKLWKYSVDALKDFLNQEDLDAVNYVM